MPSAGGWRPTDLLHVGSGAATGFGEIRLAVPVDESLDSWAKQDVVVRAPEGLELMAFRDPVVFWEGNRRRMVVGGGDAMGTALALTWTSQDGLAWDYDGVLVERPSAASSGAWMGEVWECPQLVQLAARWVLITSVWAEGSPQYAGYCVGEYAAVRLAPQDWGRLSFGDSYYAPSLFRDAAGRECLLFWMRGVRDEAAGWAGCLSVPYLLGFDDGRPVLELHPNVEACRGPEVVLRDEGLVLIAGEAVEVAWAAEPGDRLRLFAEAKQVVVLEARAGELVLERVGEAAQLAPWGGAVIQLVVDGPVLEVLAEGRVLGGAIVPSDRLQAERVRAWPIRAKTAE